MKLRISYIILKVETQQKHLQKSKVKKKIRSVDFSLRILLNLILYKCVIDQINIATKSKFKKVSKDHLKKLQSWTKYWEQNIEIQ